MARHENTSRGTHDAVFALIEEGAAGRRILDLPSGGGHFARRCAAAGHQAWAGDFVESPAGEGVRFARCDMNQRLPFEDAFFDAVACVDGIEHLERPFDFVRECRRIIRADGRLVISTPNISSMRSRMRWFLTGFHNKCKVPLDEARPTPLHHIAMISFAELRYLLHTNGFRIERVRANRIKPASWLYAPWWPVSRAMTAWVLGREERDPDQRRRNREIAATLHAPAVFFGETLVVSARRIAGG
jgi:2-polyprenyl-3-methyl-5-hydroxy-6-metoxy-1,4-benzoquinol methylase